MAQTGMSRQQMDTRFAEEALPHLGRLRMAATATDATVSRALQWLPRLHRARRQLRDLLGDHAAGRDITRQLRYYAEN